MPKIIIDTAITNEEFVNVARHNYQIELSDNLINRVAGAQKLVNKWVEEDRLMYGITTGFGAMCTEVIASEKAIELQKNIILSHAVSVGEPLAIEYVRAIMLMVILNVGTGYTGARVETIQRYGYYLNNNITPFVPKDGSVGYLSLEAHIALTIIGEGKVYYDGNLFDTFDLLNELEIIPLELSYKEGLTLVSGTTSPTGLANIALHDMKLGLKTADIIGALSLEIAKGTLRAFDERLMSVRPHKMQSITAQNVRKILDSSKYAQDNIDYRLQDALSLRCIPQQHGSAKQQIENALNIVDIETNSCCDNPIIYPIDDDGIAISGCNPDSSYVGMAMDSATIALTSVAKMSERRNNRLVDANYSENPWFLIKNPGLNSGLMIPQYTQAGLLNEMRILSHPATIDNTSTCGNQEDYVANGYTACKKSLDVIEKFEYILAIELLSIYQSYQFIDSVDVLSKGSQAIYQELNKTIPFIENDIYLYPHIEKIKDLIHSKKILEIVESSIGGLE